MKYIGIDIGKRFHVACVCDDTNAYAKHIKISSLGEGCKKLMEYLLQNEVAKKDAIIGLEATDHYWPKLNPQERDWKDAKQHICHNSELPFEDKLLVFWKYITKTHFQKNFLKKYRPA